MNTQATHNPPPAPKLMTSPNFDHIGAALDAARERALQRERAALDQDQKLGGL
jgi:hypothetical protein